MSHLVLHDVSPEVIEELRKRADRGGRSPEEEAKAVLEAALGLSKARALEGARRLRRESVSGARAGAGTGADPVRKPREGRSE